MARGRMLSKKIGRDSALESLSCDSARLLFTWAFPHADNLGRMMGDPAFVRVTAAPLRKWTDQQVSKWLGEMAQSGLIVWYESDGVRYIWFPSFDKHQSLSGNMAKTSDIPPPPDGCESIQRTNGVRTTYVQRPNGVPPEVEVEVEVEVEETTHLPEDKASGMSEDSESGNSKPQAKAVPAADWEQAFHDHFWPQFPKKVDKKLALREWCKIKPRTEEQFNAIMDGMEPWVAYWATLSSDRILYACRWLERRRWEETP